MHKEKNYVSPTLELIEFEVEVGFAQSVSTPVNGTIREFQEVTTY